MVFKLLEAALIRPPPMSFTVWPRRASTRRWAIVWPSLLSGLGTCKTNNLRCIIRRGDNASKPINGREKIVAGSLIDVEQEQSGKKVKRRNM